VDRLGIQESGPRDLIKGDGVLSTRVAPLKNFWRAATACARTIRGCAGLGLQRAKDRNDRGVIVAARGEIGFARLVCFRGGKSRRPFSGGHSGIPGQSRV
jgi:hypothetical protein